MTEQNQTPDVTTEDDTEGHGFRHRDDDTEGHVRTRDDSDDVEGHGFKHRDDDSDDVEGHGFKHRDDDSDDDAKDDDTKGHWRR
jgi:hypothetical protein